ncbi:MAG TPA: nuclear transport factor 2 family protein [Caldilineae bacterium]|nr:nuclear transport factor 2 family protein [Caldilineae bacterium]
MNTAQQSDLASLLQEYLAAVEARDLDRCLDFYTDDAIIHFAMGVYKGRQAITDWHRERFNADLRVLQLDRVSSQGDELTCELVITSKRLKAWRINTLRGKGTFRFENGKIKEARFSLAGANPLEGWR